MVGRKEFLPLVYRDSYGHSGTLLESFADPTLGLDGSITAFCRVCARRQFVEVLFPPVPPFRTEERRRPVRQGVILK